MTKAKPKPKTNPLPGKQTSEAIANRASYVMRTAPKLQKRAKALRALDADMDVLIENAMRVAASCLTQKESQRQP